VENSMQKRYGLFTAISMVVGIVIGSGIFFKATKVLANNNGDMGRSLLTVGIVGAIMLICSFVFANLASRYEKVNGVVDYAEAALSDFSCSKLFFGVDGIDLEHGITTSTIEEAKLTQVMMRSASKIIILADSSKFGQRGFGRICSLEEIDVIVTDSRISEQAVAMAEEAGVDLVIA